MNDLAIGFASVFLLVGLIYAGLPIALALALVAFVGTALIRGDVEVAAELITIAAQDGIANYIYGVVPLFVLMGLLVGAADIGKDAFTAANRIFRRIAGGLGVATVAANAIFAAITGVSIAAAAVFSKIAVPEMTANGYQKRFAVGVVAGSSVLGMLIPPSLLFIIFGVVAEVSIGDLFIAGIVPGILLAVVYSIAIVATAKLKPSLIARGGSWQHEPSSEPDQRGLAMLLWPVALLILIVLGGIYGGVFTPTEAGAAGALAALAIALGKRKLGKETTKSVLAETGYVTASICLLFVAAVMYSRMLALAGLPAFVSDVLTGTDLGLPLILTFYIGLIIVLGTILDSTSIMLVLVPIAAPVFAGLGADLVWIGLITVLAIEIGLLTPPLGLSVFVIKGSLDDPTLKLADIFIGAAPFAVMILIVLGAVIAFPGLAIGLL